MNIPIPQSCPLKVITRLNGNTVAILGRQLLGHWKTRKEAVEWLLDNGWIDLDDFLNIYRKSKGGENNSQF